MFKLKYISYFIILLTILNAEKVLGQYAFKNRGEPSVEALLANQVLGVGNVYNEELCELQNNLTENSLTFMDASAKIPAGLMVGNTNHWGHYEQCLSIDETVEGVNIRGKYCMLTVSVSIDGNFTIPGGMSRALPPGIPMSGRFAVCVPDACPATLDTFIPGIDITSEFFFCREANDKPVAPQDIVAIVVFSILGLLLLMGTSYQLYNKTLYSKDVPKIAKAFSVYHHMDKLTTLPTSENPLSSINGIRTISTLFVILGHTYASVMFGTVSNMITVFEFIQSFGFTFVLIGNLAVDTFFFMAAFLLTWSLLKKFNNGVKYAKAAPFVYLNRYLRLTPLLAAVMLLQVSFFNHVSDGPDWSTNNGVMNICLKGWWVNLLYVQNYLRPTNMCLPQSWYLAFDMQLNLVAPIVIVFLFSGMKLAIGALTVACVAALGAVLGYHFVFTVEPQFPLALDDNSQTLGDLFFLNTTRCTPQFLFGIVVAYILFQIKRRNISITNKLYMIAHWILTAALLILPFYGLYSTRHAGITQNTLIFFGAWHQSAWVLGVAGVIVACMHGFGGPVQWFLGHRMWVIPARLSYAMYLIHYDIMFAVVGSFAAPFAFSNLGMANSFINYTVLTTIFSFIIHVSVEAPFADLCNMFMARITGQNKEDKSKSVQKEEDHLPTSVEIDKEKQDQ